MADPLSVTKYQIPEIEPKQFLIKKTVCSCDETGVNIKTCLQMPTNPPKICITDFSVLKLENFQRLMVLHEHLIQFNTDEDSMPLVERSPKRGFLFNYTLAAQV